MKEEEKIKKTIKASSWRGNYYLKIFSFKYNEALSGNLAEAFRRVFNNVVKEHNGQEAFSLSIKLKDYPGGLPPYGSGNFFHHYIIAKIRSGYERDDNTIRTALNALRNTINKCNKYVRAYETYEKTYKKQAHARAIENNVTFIEDLVK